MKYVCDVVQASNLRLQKLFIVDFTVRDLLGSLFERQYLLHCDKKANELLAEVAKRLDSLVLRCLLLSSSVATTLSLLCSVLVGTVLIG